MAQLTGEERHAVKDCILRALNKLNDKDTQSTGVAELHEIFQKYVDADIVGFVVPVICKPGEQSKPYARRECLRLLGALTSTICPKADAVFNSSNLMTRICSHLKTKLGDSDATVREAAAEVLGTMAANYHAVRQLPLPCNHALFKVTIDGINGKKEQAAAAMALAKMAPHIDALDTMIVKQLLKLLSLSSFTAKPHVLAAFAHWQQENNRGGGFVTCARDSVLQSIGTLVGSNDSSNVGCLGCLASQDWGVRKAAAETLFALNRLLGPLLEHGASSDRKRVPRCVDALAAARHDRVRPVRDAVVLAIAAFTELTEWMDDNPGGDLLGWRLSCGTHPLNGRGSSSPTRSIVNGAGPLQGSSRANASAIRASAVFERFVASHPSGDTIKAAPAPPGSPPRCSPPPVVPADTPGGGGSRNGASPVSATEARATLESLQHLLEAAQRVTASPGAAAAGAVPPPLHVDLPPDTPPPSAATTSAGVPTASGQADVTAAITHIRGIVSDLAGRVSSALETLEHRVASLEARAATAPAAGPSTVISNPYFGHDRLNSPCYTVPAQRSETQLGPADMWLHAEEGLRGAATADGNMRMPPGGPPETSEDIQEFALESSKIGEDGDSTELLLAHYGTTLGSTTMASSMAGAVVEVPDALTLVPSRRSGSGHAVALPSPPPVAAAVADGAAAPRSPTAELLAAVPGGAPAAAGNSERGGGGGGGSSIASSSLGGSRHVYEMRSIGQPAVEEASAGGSTSSPSVAAPSPTAMRNPAFFQHGAAAAVAAAAADAVGGGAPAPPPLRRSFSGRSSGPERVAKDVSTRVAVLLAARNDIALLRLLQELAQPCWELLQPDVARGLLSTFCRWAEQGSNLLRMKPWLYRLADEDNAAVQAVFGAAARHRAVEAVLSASRAPGKAGAGDYGLLHSTLSAVWGGPVSVGESAGGSGSFAEPVPPASAAGASSHAPAAADGFQDLTSPLTDATDPPSPHSMRDTLASIRTIRDSLASSPSGSAQAPLEVPAHAAG